MGEVGEESFTRRSRWPGVVFSLLVPGFGLVRAGLPIRGVLWFLGLQISGLLIVLAWISESVPISIGVAALALGIGLQLWLLRDSFRPGRMTWRLWLLFVVLFAALLMIPSLPGLVAHAFKIPTNSMAPTLSGASGGVHDHVFVNRLSFLANKPERGDLVVFSTSSIRAILKGSNKEEIYYVMRVVGLPGERIEIKNGAIFADGQRWKRKMECRP